MLEIKSSRKSKMNKKQYLLVLAALVGGLSLTSPMTTKAYAEEVLYEDDTDDHKTEDIKEDDIVRDNTVVDQEEQHEEQHEEQQQEQQEEQKQSDNEKTGGDCVTPEHGYDEEAGEYWDPNIVTEPEKKGLVPEKHEVTITIPKKEKTTETQVENPTTTPVETQIATPVVQPAPQPTPAQAPKTGDMTLNEILALLAGLSVTFTGLGCVAGNIVYNKTIKRK